jgi:hypothetical protein
MPVLMKSELRSEVGNSEMPDSAGDASRPADVPPKQPRPWMAIAIVTLVALALRLVAVHYLYRATWNDFDQHLLFGFETGRIASSLAAGHGFGNPLFVATGPTAWTVPIYPSLLGLIFVLFGIYTKVSAFAILGLNALFSALVCVPIFFISRRIFDAHTAILGCWTWALYPAAISTSAFVWDTCLSALLLALLFLATFQLKEHAPVKWSHLAFGVAWGLAGLTNASLLAPFPFFAGWALAPLWTNRKEWLLATAEIALGLGIMLLPWQVRNYRALHQWIPLRDTFWLELWVGNNGNTNSVANPMAHPTINPRERAEFVRLGEISYMREKRGQALQFIAARPRLYLALCARRFFFWWTGFWNFAPGNLRTPFEGRSNLWITPLITLFMSLGLARTVRGLGSTALPFCFLLVFYPLVYYVTHPATRYRQVIDPEIIILAAAGISGILKIRRKFLVNPKTVSQRGLEPVRN